ncbi:MAG: hypothetical protein ABUT11_02865 [Leifsonia sp.]
MVAAPPGSRLGRLRGLIREAGLDAVALLLPVECAGCGRPDRSVCADCRAALLPEPSGRRLPDGTPVFSGLDYDGVARRVILAFKEQGRAELAGALAPALAAAVTEAGSVLDLRGAEVVAAAVVASTPKLFGPSLTPLREPPETFP